MIAYFLPLIGTQLFMFQGWSIKIFCLFKLQILATDQIFVFLCFKIIQNWIPLLKLKALKENLLAVK